MEILLLLRRSVVVLFRQVGHWPQVLLLAVLVLWSALGAWAQKASTDLLPPRFLPKSPTLTAFSRFDAQELVNLPTGAAQLTVPLAEISSGPLHLPFSLTYSYSGLQVYQPKDLVGLGWALQAGASISLQVNGLLDSRVTGANRYNPDSVLVASQAYLKRAANNEVDTGPDIYSFTLPGGISGRFSLRDTTVTLLPSQPVHIRALLPQANLELPQASKGGFQLTTEDGSRYLFLVAERTHASSTNFTMGNYNSAWHLNQIIGPDNADTLRLYYTQKPQQAEPLHCAVTTGHQSTNYEGTLDDSGLAACGKASTYTVNNVYVRNTTLSPQYLDSVTARGAHLALLREPGTQVVQRVRLLSTIGPRREIRRVTLFQSAFPGATPTDQRVRLDSLQESANGQKLPAYRFQYSDDGQQALPTRGSSSRDSWGYFNGALNGTPDNPTVSALLDDPRLSSLKANRAPVYDYAVLGALKQVTFPTGGATRWDYESGQVRLVSDEVGNPGGVRDTKELTVRVDYAKGIPHPIPPTNSKKIVTSDTLKFTLSEPGTIVVALTRSIVVATNTLTNSEASLTAGGEYQQNTYRDFSIWKQQIGADIPITSSSVDRNYETIDSVRHFKFALSPGTYKTVAYAEFQEVCELEFHIPYTDTMRVVTTNGSSPGAGIRVRRTCTRTPGAPPLVKTYEYLVPDKAGAYDSGVTLSGGPGYKTQEFIDNYNGDVCHSINTSSDTNQPGDEFNKYSFFYSCITVRDSTSQGATVSYYGNQFYQFNEVVLLRKQVFRQATQATSPLQLAQQDSYTYAPDSVLALPLLQSRQTLRVMGGIQSAGARDTYAADSYQLQTAYMVPVLTQQLRYDEQGAEFTTLTRATYEHQRLRQTATRTSTGWDIERYKRLSDYAASPPFTALRVNCFNPVLETQTWHRPLGSPDSVLTGSLLTRYDPAWRAPSARYRLRLAQPQAGPNQETQRNGRYTSLLSDTRYEALARVRYAAPTGDLVEQQPAHGSPTSYLLGYAHTLVIAQAQNSSYAQLAYTSFEAESAGRWTYDSVATSAARVPAARTGHYAYRLSGADVIGRDRLPAGDYLLSVWVQGAGQPSLTLLGGTPSGPLQEVASTAGNWRHLHGRLHFASPGTVQLRAASGGVAVVLDDLLLQPVGAQVSTYTHDPLVGETSQTGPDGRTLFYDYDGLGRLVRTRDEQGRILSQQQYHYAGK